ncbi:GNAT family N-acetyltransferase [Pseudotabrizicola sediminis]|uniref:GNAT family N-acetyltransferase n=1 Tax=Pseudotabrizicola sediminis TaxID=2486418 RepID=A0ABY2KH96_9RHOB|nr:GNAT family N-acetyltransferase [Pseudotabrizicola sediminis]TGD41621.1 GNAT family N-acetyltransferase [Pseudotabrizicola sediminis]TGD60986.1 GNAT family N-acetyltransferase [Tabrizicola sp. WMC-M-20]
MIADVSFVTEVRDLPAFRNLLIDYYRIVLKTFEAAGGPALLPEELAESSLEHLDEMLPPEGRLVLARGEGGQLLGCGTLRRIRPDAVEMKRMFVRPEAQGLGLGRRLFEMRIEEARNMGCRAIYADTAKGNRPMLSIYERFGFNYIPRYPENANPPEFEPYLVYLEYRFPQPLD